MTTEPKEEQGKGEDRAVVGSYERALEVGYFGAEVDPTPDANYTLAGAASGAPTPETDAKHAEKVRREQKARGLA